MPMPDFAADRRLIPRIAQVLPLLSSEEAVAPITSREQALALSHTPEAIARRKLVKAATEAIDSEKVVPFAGTSTETLTFESSPDGNVIPCHVTRPDGATAAPG